MGLMKDLLFGKPAPEAKASATSEILMVGPREVAWSKRNFEAFAKEGYQSNVVAYQAINKIAEAVASIKWGAWAGETQFETHPLLDLMAQPNPTQSGQEFMTSLVGFLMISGNAYTERVRIGSATREMYIQRSDRMKVIKSSTGLSGGYEYSNQGRSFRWDVDPNTQQSDILHTKLFNPLDDWYGMSPLEAGAYAIDQHNLAMSWVQSLLQNSARPSGALVSSRPNPLTDDQFRRLKTEMDEKYSGATNAGKPMLLEGGLDWKEMGLSPVEMGIIETKSSAARDISLALGVPPQMLGIKGDSTYNNYQEARLAFWEDTVIPLVNHIAGDLNGWFADEYQGVELRPEMDEIPAIVEKRLQLWAMADTSTDLTINEKRALKGFEPIAGGDTILVNASMISLTDATASLDIGSIDEKALAKIAGYDTKA